MEKQIGIDKEKILKLSKKIREAWNDFFWESRVCQHHIRFTREERSNYIGDLFNYFDDTIYHLESFEMKSDYLSSLYETVAVLQFMYVQQDLIDELLRLFKLSKSDSKDKLFIRQLRNELVGHPISRDRYGDLICSVFVTGSSKNSTLAYIRYHRDKDYKFDLITLHWESIFKKHEDYLKHYLGLIIRKVEGILLHFANTLQSLSNNTSKISFEKLVSWVSQVFEIYYSHYDLFAPDNILYCYYHRQKHSRYNYVIELFQDGLNEQLAEFIGSVKEFCNPQEKIKFREVKEGIVTVVSYCEQPSKEFNRKNEKINYEFGKLHERDHVFGISYFRRNFCDDSEVMEELDNMERNNSERNVEFHCSYEYLRFLFERRGLL
jgi:hypothetical protein